MVVRDRFYTVNDLMNMPDDGKIYELHNGELIEVAGSKYEQTILAAWIIYLLISFVEEMQLGGQVSGADGTYVLSRYNTRIPDVGYITKEPAQRQQAGQYLNGAPDLVVEVVSETNTAAEMRQRVGAYLDAGSRLIWLVYPATLTIEVYRPEQNTLTLTDDAVLDGYDVLPGLALPVSRIFQRLKG